MNLGDRMKTYEDAAENVLPLRLPLILRLDGNSFSKLTSKTFVKPFDLRFEEAMNAATVAVLEYCSGAMIAYSQSDEISILLRNDLSRETQPFLANRTQKLASLCAAKASVAFNAALANLGIDTEAVFDCRVFVLPESEVTNYFLWRQQDAFRNCISSYAYWHLRDKHGRKTAQKMLHGKDASERQELIFQELGENPNDIRTAWKRGRCFVRTTREVPLRDVMPPEKFAELLEKGRVESDQVAIRSDWSVDEEIPLFNEDRNYIDRFLSENEDD